MARPNETGMDTTQAIARVLSAEREARGAVARCEREALRVTEEARARAAAIAARADERIAAARARLAARVSVEVARLEAEGAALDAGAPDDGDAEHLSAAVAALAAELTGGSR